MIPWRNVFKVIFYILFLIHCIYIYFCARVSFHAHKILCLEQSYFSVWNSAWPQGASSFITFIVCCSSATSHARLKPDVRMVDQHRAQFTVWRGKRRSTAPHFAFADSRTRGGYTPAQRWRPLLSQTPQSLLSGRWIVTDDFIPSTSRMFPFRTFPSLCLVPLIVVFIIFRCDNTFIWFSGFFILF